MRLLKCLESCERHEHADGLGFAVAVQLAFEGMSVAASGDDSDRASLVEATVAWYAH